jgi:hypothetical protein
MAATSCSYSLVHGHFVFWPVTFLRLADINTLHDDLLIQTLAVNSSLNLVELTS